MNIFPRKGSAGVSTTNKRFNFSVLCFHWNCIIFQNITSKKWKFWAVQFRLSSSAIVRTLVILAEIYIQFWILHVPPKTTTFLTLPLSKRTKSTTSHLTFLFLIKHLRISSNFSFYKQTPQDSAVGCCCNVAVVVGWWGNAVGGCCSTVGGVE